MKIEHISNDIHIKRYLEELGVDGGGIGVLSKKHSIELFHIKSLHVGGANILKQDALSVGADVAVPKGTILAEEPHVDAILMATPRQIEKLSQKLKAQPFSLKDVAKELYASLHVEKFSDIKIMGVVNANDDSFYMQSRFKDKDALIQIEKMINDGANIIDVGGVSSRPNSQSVSDDEELSRVTPIIDLIYKHSLNKYAKFSIDSYSPKVIEYALSLGFEIVNDITGLNNDKVCELCASFGASAVIMHMQKTPENMQDNPQYDSILSDVSDFFEERIQKAKNFGIKDIILDVGIGFGKTLEHNISLLKNLSHFKRFSRELLIGASRKSMIDKIVSSKVEDRLSGTLALHLEALKNGASILRVHDVKEHYQAIEVYKAIKQF
jgi:dihydropteroate synthase